jgi:hypothetical protein
MMDALEVQGIVKKPVAFTASESVSAKDLADLMLIVKVQ